MEYGQLILGLLFCLGLLIPIVGLVVALINSDSLWERIELLMIGTLFIIIIACIPYMLIVTSIYDEREEDTITSRQTLEGVRSGSETHGSGGLFTFLIQSSDNYIGWRKKDGGLQKFSMPQSSIVYEEDDLKHSGYY